MAVAFVIGNSTRFTASLLEPGTTIAALIANDFGEATETYRSALLLLGFVLFIVTFIVLAIARLMLGHLARREGNRSEEHTSELQSLMRISYAVFCLKKTKAQT